MRSMVGGEGVAISSDGRGQYTLDFPAATAPSTACGGPPPPLRGGG